MLELKLGGYFVLVVDIWGSKIEILIVYRIILIIGRASCR